MCEALGGVISSVQRGPNEGHKNTPKFNSFFLHKRKLTESGSISQGWPTQLARGRAGTQHQMGGAGSQMGGAGSLAGLGRKGSSEHAQSFLAGSVDREGAALSNRGMVCVGKVLPRIWVEVFLEAHCTDRYAGSRRAPRGREPTRSFLLLCC